MSHFYGPFEVLHINTSLASKELVDFGPSPDIRQSRQREHNPGKNGQAVIFYTLNDTKADHSKRLSWEEDAKKIHIPEQHPHRPL